MGVAGRKWNRNKVLEETIYKYVRDTFMSPKNLTDNQVLFLADFFRTTPETIRKISNMRFGELDYMKF